MKRESLKIFIIESLNSSDIYSGRREGIAISEMLNILEIKSQYKVVQDIKYLKKAIQSASEKKYSIIHLSAHGNSYGIQLTNKNATVNWVDLANLIQPFSSENKGLIISCCQSGIYGVTRYLPKMKRKPGFVIGPAGDMPFADSLIAWSIFYKMISEKGLNKQSIRNAVIAMRCVAEGDFICRYLEKENGKYLKLRRNSIYNSTNRS